MALSSYSSLFYLYSILAFLFGISSLNIDELAARLTEGDVPNEESEMIDRARLTTGNDKWPKNSSGIVVVPYTMASDIAADPTRKEAILKAINLFAEKTCVQFVPLKYQIDYIEFFDGAKDKTNPRREGPCFSYIGRIGGKQPLSVGLRCNVKVGIILHEMNHALGMIHEQSRPDRDSFVTIDYSNISPGNKNNFIKYGTQDVDVLNTKYDYESIMHYSQYSFALRSGSPAIITKDTKYQTLIGQRNGFSDCDLAKINRLYECRGKVQTCETNDATLSQTIFSSSTSTAPPKTSSSSSSSSTSSKTSTTSTTPASTSTSTIKATVPTLFPINTTTCSEVHPQCWRSKANETECDKYPGLYLFNCPNSCQNCDGKKCYDTNVEGYKFYCKVWGTRPRYCQISQIIQYLCPFTCGYC